MKCLVILVALTVCSSDDDNSTLNSYASFTRQNIDKVDCSFKSAKEMMSEHGSFNADAKAFRFIDTVLVIPLNWLGTLPNGPSPLIDGRFEPALRASECPGIVHKVTNGGSALPRYADIFVDFTKISGAEKFPKIKALEFMKIRKSGSVRESDYPIYLNDGVIDAKDHRGADPYIYFCPDIGVRVIKARHALAGQARGELSVRGNASGIADPFRGLLATEEEAAIRRLATWLSGPALQGAAPKSFSF